MIVWLSKNMDVQARIIVTTLLFSWLVLITVITIFQYREIARRGDEQRRSILEVQRDMVHRLDVLAERLEAQAESRRRILEKLGLTK